MIYATELDALLENIGVEDSGKDNCSPSSHSSIAPDLKKSDIDLLKKLQK
jgi:hypothetical protein